MRATISPRLAGPRDRGAVIPIVALVLPVLVLMTAFAVDLGRQRTLRRDLQAAADVIALDLSRIIPDDHSEPTPADTLAALNASLVRNGMDPVAGHQDLDAHGVRVEWGTWTPPTTGDQCPAPIVTAPPTCFTAGTTPVNAVRVTLRDEIDYFFQPGSGGATRSAVAMIGADDIGSFSIGSSLARLRAGDSTLLNPLLSGFLGSPVNLGALDYQGLVAADVTLLDLLHAHPTAGSVDELLSTPLDVAQFRLLLVEALNRRGMTAQATLIQSLPIDIPTPSVVVLGDLIDLASRDEAALDAAISAFDLLLAGAQLANGSNFVNLDLGIPNLASVRVQVTEPPRIAVGPAARGPHGEWVTRATSANLRVELLVTAADLDISLLGLAGAKVALNVPIVITGGGATGYLTRIDCRSSPEVLDVLTVPRPVSIGIEATSPPLAEISAVLLLVPVKVARVTADVESSPEDPGTLPNPTLSIPVGDMRSGAVRGLGLGNLLTVNDLTLELIGIPLPVGGIVGPLLTQVLSPTLSLVDAALDPLLQLLGIRIGETDVRALSAQCDSAGVRLVG